MALLETKEVDYYYQDGDQRRYILKETSAAFEKGKFYAILGQSGQENHISLFDQCVGYT